MNLRGQIPNFVIDQKSISDTKHRPSVHLSNTKSRPPGRKCPILTSWVPRQHCKYYYHWCQSKYHFLSNFHVYSISVALIVHENTLKGYRGHESYNVHNVDHSLYVIAHSLYFIVQSHRVPKNLSKMWNSLEWITIYRTQMFPILSRDETQTVIYLLLIQQDQTVLEEPSSTLTP